TAPPNESPKRSSTSRASSGKKRPRPRQTATYAAVKLGRSSRMARVKHACVLAAASRRGVAPGPRSRFDKPSVCSVLVNCFGPRACVQGGREAASSTILRASMASLLPLLTLALGATPHLSAHRIEKPPVIDGRLDDAAWREAKGADSFTQKFPDEGTSPSE